MLPITDDISTLPPELRAAALHCLAEQDAATKVAAVGGLADAWRQGEITLVADKLLRATKPVPGRPSRPELVSPLAVGRRSMHTIAGRAALIHALAHIEFNAIKI